MNIDKPIKKWAAGKFNGGLHPLSGWVNLGLYNHGYKPLLIFKVTNQSDDIKLCLTSEVVQ